MDTDFRQRLEKSIKTLMPDFGIDLAAETIHELGKYYEILNRWNARLHLVAPCSPEEFAQLHLLESLLLLRFLPVDVSVTDVGSGAGLPIIPCLIARTDLTAALVESSQKKSVFLREVLNQLGISNRGTIIAQPFEKFAPTHASYVSCRALDNFMNKVSALVDWTSPTSVLLLYGGETLRQKLEGLDVNYTEYLIPLSEKRFLFEVKKPPR